MSNYEFKLQPQIARFTWLPSHTPLFTLNHRGKKLNESLTAWFFTSSKKLLSREKKISFSFPPHLVKLFLFYQQNFSFIYYSNCDLNWIYFLIGTFSLLSSHWALAISPSAPHFYLLFFFFFFKSSLLRAFVSTLYTSYVDYRWQH